MKGMGFAAHSRCLGLLALLALGASGCWWGASPKRSLAAPVWADPPRMAWSPTLGAFLALDTQQRLLFYGGSYYLFADRTWHLGTGYAGDWRPLPGGSVPAPLRRLAPARWSRLQAEARLLAEQRPAGAVHRAFPAAPGRRAPGPSPGPE